MKETAQSTRRQLLHLLCGLGGVCLLSSCGTILYPDRAHQMQRGRLDPAVVILDGIGLFFFLVPGVIAFAVDFATGAIYYPADHAPGDRERTLFDDLTRQVPQTTGRLTRDDIEQAAGERAGAEVDLSRSDVQVVELAHPNEFREVLARLSRPAKVSANRTAAL